MRHNDLRQANPVSCLSVRCRNRARVGHIDTFVPLQDQSIENDLTAFAAVDNPSVSSLPNPTESSGLLNAVPQTTKIPAPLQSAVTPSLSGENAQTTSVDNVSTFPPAALLSATTIALPSSPENQASDSLTSQGSAATTTWTDAVPTLAIPTSLLSPPTSFQQSVRSVQSSNVIFASARTPSQQLDGTESVQPSNTAVTQATGSIGLRPNIGSFTSGAIMATAASNPDQTTGSLDNLFSIFGKFVSTPSALDFTATATAPTTTNALSILQSAETEPATTNALSVLESALPSNEASSFQSAFSSEVTAIQASLLLPTATRLLSTSDTATPISKQWTATTSPTSTPTTMTTTPSSTLSHLPSATQTDSASPGSNDGSHPISNASVAGIAAGLSAGAVLIALGGLYLYRQRKRGKAPFGPRGSQRSRGSGRVYPEVAWLYDPRMTPEGSPSHSRRGSGAGENLMSEQRAGSAEMSEAHGSPNLRPGGAASPLLTPQAPYHRSESPGGSPSRSSGGRSPRRSRGSREMSGENARRPLGAIFEESEAR